MSMLEHLLHGTSAADNEVNQDVNDPVWESEVPAITGIVDDSRSMHELGSAEPVRTISNGLDFMHGLVEDIQEWIERETEHGAGHNYPRSRRQPDPIAVWEHRASSWRGVTFNTDNFEGSFRIAEKRPDRVRVIIVNWGPGILYLSADSAGLTSQPRVNCVQVPISTATLWAPRIFEHRDEIWAIGAVSGTAQVVDVQDEYGMEF